MDDIIAKACAIRDSSGRLEITLDSDIDSFNWWRTTHILEEATITITTGILTIRGTKRVYYPVINSCGEKVDRSFLDQFELPADSPCWEQRTRRFSKKIYHYMEYGLYLKKKTEPFSLISSLPFTILNNG